jgi:hypothetical protein
MYVPKQTSFIHCFSQVCGLSWSEELQLLASGGNEGDVWRPGASYFLWLTMVINGLLMVNNMVYWYNGNWYNNNDTMVNDDYCILKMVNDVTMVIILHD